jgi:hypothetical protein
MSDDVRIWAVRHPGIGIIYYDSEDEARVAAGTAGEILPPQEGYGEHRVHRHPCPTGADHTHTCNRPGCNP